MTKTFIGRTVFILIAFVSLLPAYAQYHGRHEHGRHHGEKERGISYISGKIISTEDDSPLDFATVYLKGTTYGCTSDEEGVFRMKAPQGDYVLVVSAVGYETVERKVKLRAGERHKVHVRIEQSVMSLDEVVVVSSGVGRVKRSAFNAVAVDTKEMHNSTKNLSEALNRLPGLKLRESGGVGSDMQLMLDGFSGKHVKIFIDGVPQEGAGAAFDLNNIPVNFAERIEVYKGVVPVGFGTDALGGVVNIVTNKNKRRWFADASYSYGSFNTHKSYVNFGQSFKNGLTYEINAFQNYSDNDYYVDTYVTEFEGDIIESTDESKVYRLKRFNDTFHNEAVIGKVGVTDRKWADRFMLGFTFSHFYKEIQTGVEQDIVFGQKHRKGHSFVPSLEYRKSDLGVKGLDLALTANYNHNMTNNIDTASYKYNWRGEKKYTGSPGEQSNQNNQSKNVNWNGTATLNYRIGHKHVFTFNHVVSTFRRTTRSYIAGSSKLSDFSMPKITRKNISGLSYRVMPSEKWNLSVFGKYYNQYNQGPVSLSDDGIGNYVQMKKHISSLGYGAAGTYFFMPELQAKLSYEKAYRLPTTDELFGDEDLEAGKADLKPEKSDNFNFNVSYGGSFGKHSLYVEGGLIYRDTKDYIRRGLDAVGGMSFGFYENHGRVKTKGYNVSARYTFSQWFSIGGTYNDMNARNDEKYRAGGTMQESLTYGQRIPNQPYRYANFDAAFYWNDLFAKGNVLTVSYDSYYQHEFPLYWESIGDASSKRKVPEQFSHNLTVSYSVKNGRYNFSFECRNFTDEKLYDNYSLQKAGRAFYGKVRVWLGR